MHNILFLIVFLPPLLYSIGNILDKQLIYKGGTSSPLLIVTTSSLLAILVVPIIYLFAELKNPSFVEICVMVFSGLITALSVFFYLKALESESVFSIAPALQLTPVFSYIFGIVLFQEFISVTKIVGCLVIMAGSFFLTLRIERIKGKDYFKINIFILTALSALSLSISGALFKFFAVQYNYWTVQFYEYIGLLILGIVLVCLIPKIRSRIYDMLILKKDRTFALLNLSTEGIMVLGDLTLNYATLLVPLAIGFSFNALQPLFLIFSSLLIHKISNRFNVHINIGRHNKSTLLYSTIITIGAIMVVLF